MVGSVDCRPMQLTLPVWVLNPMVDRNEGDEQSLPGLARVCHCRIPGGAANKEVDAEMTAITRTKSLWVFIAEVVVLKEIYSSKLGIVIKKGSPLHTRALRFVCLISSRSAARESSASQIQIERTKELILTNMQQCPKRAGLV